MKHQHIMLGFPAMAEERYSYNNFHTLLNERRIMNEPPLNSLLEIAADRFSLCIITGKRARQLINGAKKLTSCESKNFITLAVNEIYENKITFIRTKTGIK